MSDVHFTATKYQNLKKEGKFEPDADGYYTVVIGGLNVKNSAGQYYALGNSASLFEKSSLFMRRVTNGNLRGECGHPVKEPGMTEDQYIDRALEVRETNTCVHFKEIWLDYNFGKTRPHLNAPEMIGILAKIRPTGPKGPALEAALKNPHENVCFSIRCFTDWKYIGGRRCKVIDEIITFDWVGEPGIAGANKWDSPAFESATLSTVVDSPVSMRAVKKILQDRPGKVSQESSVAIAKSLIERHTPSVLADVRPMALSKW